MLSYADTVKASRQAARPFNEIVPVMLMLTDTVILNKNGSLTAAFEISGVDLEGKLQDAYDSIANNQQRSFAGFDDCITLNQYVDRTRTVDYPEAEFSDPISAGIDAEWREGFQSGKQFANRLSLFFTFTPKRTGDGLFDRVTAMMAREGVSWTTAIVRAAKGLLSVSSEMAYTSDELESYLQRFEEQLGSYASSFSSGDIRRLHGSQFLGALARRINLNPDIDSVRTTDAPIYLDSLLTSATVESDSNSPQVLCVHGETTKYISAITVKEWPARSFPGMLDYLLAIPGQFSVHHAFRFVSSSDADAHCTKMEKHHRDLAVKFKDMVRAGVTGTEPTQYDEGRMTLSAEAAAARASIVSAGERFGYYHFSVIAIGDTKEELEATVSELKKALARFELVSIRETIGLFSAFAGNIPGNHDLLLRWFFFSTSAFADLIHLRTFFSGPLVNLHYSEQARSPQASLAAFPTGHNTPFFFNPHVGDIGHAMLVGPTGSGKTSIACFLHAQFQKYPKAKTYIFDKDESCRTGVLMTGGTCINLRQDGTARMNPYSLLSIRDEDGRVTHLDWLKSFTIYLLESMSETPLDAEKGEYEDVERALALTADAGSHLHNLSGVAGTFSPSLKRRIGPWLRGNSNGVFFDNDSDSFELSNYMCLEMGELLENNPNTALAVIDYVVKRIEMSLKEGTGEPTLIYIEELWYMLRNEKLKAVIENWLRVLRKKNAMLWFATQSLDELAKSEIASAFINNIPTKIYLANESARSVQNYKLYTEVFGLNDAQVEQIQRAFPKKNYLIVQGGVSRLVWAAFTPTILACFRGDKAARALFERKYAGRESNPTWKTDYIQELVHENA